MKNRFIFFLFMGLIVIINSCKTKTENFNSNFLLYSDYITNFTSGVVSTASPIQVGLNFENQEWKPNQELDKKLFSISPKIDGKIIALSTNSISFIPTKRLKQDQEYQVKFHLSKIKDVPKELSDFNFIVKTIKHDFLVETLDLQSYNKDYYFLNGLITTSDIMSSDEITGLITSSLGKVKINGKIKDAREFPFIVDSIPVSEKATILKLKLNKKDSKVEDIEVQIPAKGVFDVINMKVTDEGNQSFWINFSSPIKRNQNFAGLVSANNINNLKYSVDGNLLKVYTDSVFQGKIPIEVFQGIENIEGKKLSKVFRGELFFEQQKPEVRLAKNGNILPSSENLKINFQTTNLKAIDVKVYKIYKNNILQFLQENENIGGSYKLRQVSRPVVTKTIDLAENNLLSLKKWGTYALDLSTLIQPDPGAVYRVEFSFKKKYSLYNCPNTDEKDEETEVVETEESYDYDYDYDDDYYYYHYGYNWEEKDNPCAKSYYYNKSVATNVIATDLGVIAKRGENNSYFFAVNNIITTEPVSKAIVELYNYQQQLITSGETNNEGIVIFKEEVKGFFAIVKKGKNTTYIKLGDGNELSVSNFNVDGLRTEKGLKGYIYGERGVWRPGDFIYLGFILNDKANEIPNNHPIKVKFTDPQGKIVNQQVLPKNENNHYKYVLSTSQDAPTGNWHAEISVGGAKFYKTIKIETIKPNRLKIKNNLEGKMISKNGSKATLNITWLHGATAKNLKTEVKAKLYAQQTTFKNYTKYSFDDPTKSFGTEEISLYSDKTNQSGNISFLLKPKIGNNSPGMLKTVILTKVHENGGDFSSDVSSATYSPYSVYVGLQSPETNKYGMLETDKDNIFKIITLDENGVPTANRDVDIEVYKIDWSWWWDASNQNISNYDSSKLNRPYYSTSVKTDEKGAESFRLNVPESDWGRYLIMIKDGKEGHSSAQIMEIDWPIWSGKSRNRGAEDALVLSLATDKEKYNVGETAKISFPSSEGGRALISVESGSEIVKTYWVMTAKGETVFELPISKEMSPNVYINITMLQKHANTINDSPIRLYGITPIIVEDKNTILKPVISMKDVLKPEEKTTIKISESSGKPMTYTLAIVEDGLLDLTRFKTPNAWDNFYAKTALGIKTWDVYNDIIGAYGGAVNQVFSIGGDEDLGAGEAKKASRFKPVVVYLGPFFLNKGQSKTHEVTLPKYIGSVRVMIVASDNKNNVYGNAEKTVPVRSPLMVLGTLPRKAVPSEKIMLPVTVFAMGNYVKNVELKVKTDNKFRVINGNTQTLNFDQPDEKTAYFELETGNTEGIAKVTIEAVSGKEKASYDIELDVLNPNPRTFRYKEIVIESGQTADIEWSQFGVEKSNKAQLEVSSFPGINLNQRLNYLIAYPHGCAEQITSGVFPQLFLGELMDITNKQKEDIQRNVSAGIERLAKNQFSDGGFSYWPGNRSYDDWTTSYIGHFYLEAEKKGYILPANSKANWVSFQQKTARQWRYESRYRNDVAQAYRLYTLALANSPDISSMNRLRETSGISDESKLRLAAAYALVGQPNIANKLVSQAAIDGSSSGNYYYYGSQVRSQSMALETLLLLGQNQKAFDLGMKIANKLSSSDWMSTQTTAYALYSMTKFAAANKSTQGISIDITQAGKPENIKSTKNFISKDLVVSSGSNTVKLKNNNEGTVYVKIAYSGILPVGEELVEQRGFIVTTIFRDVNSNISPLEISQGTEFYSEITVKNITQQRVENIALSQIIPSGWEIVNMRYTDYGGDNNKADYIDIRDDRTNLYFPLNAFESRVFKISLNASYLGRYYLPGTQCEAMYDNRYTTRTQGAWIEVVK